MYFNSIEIIIFMKYDIFEKIYIPWTFRFPNAVAQCLENDMQSINYVSPNTRNSA